MGSATGAARLAESPATSPSSPADQRSTERRGPLGAMHHRGRRLVRRLRYALRPPALRIVYDPAYAQTIWGAPLDLRRADRVLAFLAEEELLRREEISRPRPAGLHNVLAVHTPAYLESLQDRTVLASILGSAVEDEVADSAVELQRLMVGGTIQASRIALGLGCVAVNLGGGLHHAGTDRGMGFCVFNDIAIAVRRLRRRGFDGRVLVVDLDLHDGNGTREIFAADESVHTYSIHNEHWGPTEAVASTSIALGGGVEDDPYLGLLLRTLPRLFERFAPRLVVYVAGCDIAGDDALGNWHISAEGILARDRLVLDLVRNRDLPLVVVLGGGYGEHAWRYTARLIAWLLAHREIEPPSTDELTLMRFRQIKRQLDTIDLTREDGDTFQLSEEDLVGIQPGIPHQTRFLNYFSKVGVELLLERFGIFDQLRARGFRHPLVELELNHPVGQTLRIWADDDARRLLIELRVARSSREVEGMEVLVVEWLLLQDPRRAFTATRPPLPGQRYPGLGMLGELFGWLVVLSETLELDGLVFSTGHYHIAALARPFARFLDPAHEALYRAVHALVQALPLGEASHVVEEGRIVQRGSREAVGWEGFPMAVAATTRLRERLSSDDYHRAVEAESARLDLVLATPSTTRQ
jgi:acetoin utilization deacetylase AcuC-like enzyme